MPKSAAPPDQPLQERSAARPATPRAQRRPTSHSKSAAPPYRRRLSAAAVGGNLPTFPHPLLAATGQAVCPSAWVPAAWNPGGRGRLAALLVLIPAAALAEPGRSLV